MPDPVLVVHGGCGNPRGGGVRNEPAYLLALEEALAAGWAALESGGALEGVQAAVESLEDCPLFNAGRGSVLTSEGTVETDAALMTGDGRAGAVAAVTGVRHAVLLARLVMDETAHVMLAGTGAEALAEEHGLDLREQSWFVTDRQHERWLASQGTVGAVALDAGGRLAAGTSTGGVAGQLPGRVGDSPLIGAGTWCDELCAISATGSGEAIIRVAAAHEVASLIRHAGLSLIEAGERVVRMIQGDGGLIAVDKNGNVAMPFGTTVMHRGVRRGDTVESRVTSHQSPDSRPP